MKKLTYLIISILSTTFLFSQCNKPTFIDDDLTDFHADPYDNVNFYFVNQTYKKCYVELSLNDYFYEKHRWDNEYKDTLSCLTPQLVEPNSSKLILHDEGHVSADYNLPFRLGSLIVKNELGDIIYAQSPIKDELWDSVDKSEGLMWATNYYFNFKGQAGDTINSIYCKCNLNDTNKLKKHPVAYIVNNRFTNDTIIVNIEFNKNDNGHYNVESYPDTLSMIIPPMQQDVVIIRDTIPQCSFLEKPSNFFSSLIVHKTDGNILFEQMKYNNCLWFGYWYKGEERYILNIGSENNNDRRNNR